MSERGFSRTTEARGISAAHYCFVIKTKWETVKRNKGQAWLKKTPFKSPAGCYNNSHLSFFPTSADGALPELFIFNELCALKDEPGPCKAIKDRYFFNVDTGRCEVFEYGGCGGNANNFETLEACEGMCVVSVSSQTNLHRKDTFGGVEFLAPADPKVTLNKRSWMEMRRYKRSVIYFFPQGACPRQYDKNPCHLAEAPGPCRGLLVRYFFDSRSQQCKQFFYGGCFGNANNFRSMQECQAKCQSPAAQTQVPEVHTHSARKSNVVQPTIMTGEMTVGEPQARRNVTLPKNMKQTELCFSPIERGTCHGAERRFAFNHKTKKCQMFTYSGCRGNENNFVHRKDCIIKCIRRRK
ncbi:hypothetical protein L3Q82_017733, partial [Scortum barcoo]